MKIDAGQALPTYSMLQKQFLRLLHADTGAGIQPQKEFMYPNNILVQANLSNKIRIVLGRSPFFNVWGDRVYS